MLRQSAVVLLACLCLRAAVVDAQNPPVDSARAHPDTTRARSDTTRAPLEAEHAHLDTLTQWGAVDAGNGFIVGKTKYGALSISAYALWRYLNQLPVHQSYLTHLNELRVIDTRNDIQLHRIQVFFKGWIYLPKFRYSINVWTVNATQQVAVVAALTYQFSNAFKLSGGVNGLPGARTLAGSHPYWLAPDRVMADEYFRPGFTSGLWATGEVLPRFYYTAMVGDNLSQLGITAGQLTRNLATGASVWWMPTTGEFGPRGAYGDYEEHPKLATRFGTSYAHSHEDRFNQLAEASPDNTQIRLSDATLLFETGTLAPGVTVKDATYQLNAADAGFKYRGAFLQMEYFYRRLNRFVADGVLPQASIVDQGFYVQSAYMVVPKKAEAYLSTSQIYGAFNKSWEVLGGANWYPADTRNFRVNLQVIGVHRSPVSSSFGYYVGGLRGVIVSTATSFLF